MEGPLWFFFFNGACVRNGRLSFACDRGGIDLLNESESEEARAVVVVVALALGSVASGLLLAAAGVQVLAVYLRLFFLLS